MSQSFQPMLFEAEVVKTGPGKATVTAGKVVAEGNVDRVRVVLGGLEVVSRSTVHRIRKNKKNGIIAWQPNGGGKRRSDGRASNAKWVFDMASVYRYRDRMRRQAARLN